MNTPRTLWRSAGLAALAGALVIANVHFFLHTEEPVYIWDTHFYWVVWQKTALVFWHAPADWLRDLLTSMRDDDYNILPVALLFPFQRLPFGSRQDYILAVALCYLWPVALLTAGVLARLRPAAAGWAAFLLIAAITYAPFWAPTLRGYPDIVGLIPILLMIRYAMRRDFGARLTARSVILTGLLLWAPFGLRRWYAYSVVGLYITLPVYSYFLFSGGVQWRRARNILLHFAAAGLVSTLAAILLQKGLVRRILHTSYAGIYAAYQDGFAASLSMLLGGPGWLILPPFAAGLLWCAMPGGERTAKLFGLFCAANLAISFWLFTRTQTPGIQHCLPFALWMFFVALLGVHWLLDLLQALRGTALALGAAACLLICIATFYRPDTAALDIESPWLPAHIYPLRLGNFQNYQALTAQITRLVAGGRNFSVLSSNENLSDDLLTTLSAEKLASTLAESAQVDARDRLHLPTFQTDYVVVADPVQLHLNPDGQRVISIPATDLLTGQTIGAAYEALPERYALANGVNAIIYRKSRAFTPREAQAFLAQFLAIYPDWAVFYGQGSLAVPYLTAQITKGDIWGMFMSDANDAVVTHPGEHRPTEAAWYFDQVKTVTIRVPAHCPQADGVLVTFSAPGVATLAVDVPPGSARSADLTAFDGRAGTVSIDKKQNSICDLTIISTP